MNRVTRNETMNPWPGVCVVCLWSVSWLVDIRVAALQFRFFVLCAVVIVPVLGL